MKLSNLKPAKGSVKTNKRVGRGVGAGSGRTATRGHKGAKARSGFSNMRYFQGGQMPLQKLVPKRGFKNVHRRYKEGRPDAYAPINISDLAAYAEKAGVQEITPAVLEQLGVISKGESYKILGNGELKAGLEVTAHRFSASAKKAIQDAGGKAFLLYKLNTLQGIAHVAGVDTIDLELMRKHFDHIGEDDAVHVVAEGSISQKLTLNVNKVSDEARQQVEAQGGSVTLA